MKQPTNAHDSSLESLLLLIAYAKEEARRLQMTDVAEMLELPELAVLQTYTGFEKEDLGRISTMSEALSELLEKSN